MGTTAQSFRLRRIMRLSTVEGAFAQIFLGLAAPGASFLTAFAMSLGASAEHAPIQLGILAAIGPVSQVFQILGVWVTRQFINRKLATLVLVGAARACVLAFPILPFVLSPADALTAFLALLLVSAVLHSLGGNAWTAWIADLIPLKIRGRFFAVRNQVLLVVSAIGGMACGLLIDEGPRHGWLSAEQAFAVIFGMAGAAGLISVILLTRQQDRRRLLPVEPLGDMFSQTVRDKNFVALMVFGVWWMLGCNIGAPFWTPFLLSRMGCSMAEVQLYGIIQTVCMVAALPLWGVLIDRKGNKFAMRIAICMATFNPWVWLFATPEIKFILFMEAGTSGIMWAGGNLVAMNFVLAIAPPQRRQIYAGLYAAVCGLGAMITAFGSGVVVAWLPVVGPLGWVPEQMLFFCSGLARLSAHIPLSWVRERVEQPKPFAKPRSPEPHGISMFRRAG